MSTSPTGRSASVARGVGARIDADQWSYRYPGRADRALVDATFTVLPGQLVVLLGASGSGKSTLLRGLAGVLPEGTTDGALVIRADGVPAARGTSAVGPARTSASGVVSTADPARTPGPANASSGDPVSPAVPASPEVDASPPDRRNDRPGWSDRGAAGAFVGLVSQDPQSNVVMETVGDDLAFPLENRAVAPGQIWSRIAAARAAVGLAPPVTRQTTQLSGGQLQQLAIAAATVGDPPLLLLDEPTANLDAAAAGVIVQTVLAERARTGCTVVVIEHRVAPWLHSADLVLVADQGVVTAVTAPELPEFLSERPTVARQVWLATTDLPAWGPRTAPGEVVLSADRIAVAGRLAPTGLTCRAGEVVALTGAPGSGKSTLLACLAGLLTPTSGSVALAGGRRDPWTWAAASVPRTFGVVFQNPEHQFLTGSVRAELEHGLDPSDGTVRSRVDELLGRLGLGALATADPFSLSGGEQRRLSVGTALVAQPDVLLLDEPTFGQDPTTWREVVAIIAEHRDAGGAVVIATHDPLLVRALGAREVRLTAVAAESTARERAGDVKRTPPTRAGVPARSDRHAPPDPAQPAGAPVDGIPADVAGANRPRAVVMPDSVGAGIGSATSDALGARGARGLRSLDPLALLAAAGLLTVAALASNSVAFNLTLAAAALAIGLLGGLSLRWVALLAVPALIATGSVALSNALLGEHGLFSAESWQAAALPASRILAVAVPGLIAAASMDPTGLADSLVVRLRVGPRVAYSVLAGLRLLPLLADEWGVLARASRARGLGGRGPAARARLFTSMAFRLLVSALRRGGRLAIALDARGLTGSRDRTIARPVRWRARDSMALLGGVGVLILGIFTR